MEDKIGSRGNELNEMMESIQQKLSKNAVKFGKINDEDDEGSQLIDTTRKR